jgi:3-oxoacyl-[acyl-carrier-protein] synthase III
MEASIKHITYYLPPKIISNKDLAKVFPEFTPAQIFKKTGVKKRTHTSVDCIGSDMAFHAAQKLFTESDIDKEDIDFLIYVTEGLDYKAPATAVILQDRLGLSMNIGAIDVPLGCSGFTHALGLAKMVISSGQGKDVLLLFGDTPSFVSHPNDFVLRSLFSDAGAAVWVSLSDIPSIGHFVYGSDGSGLKNLFVDQSSTRNPLDQKWLESNADAGGMVYGQMKMDGLEVFTFSLQRVPILVNDILKKNKLSFEDIDLFVFHQASNIILKSVQRKLKIPDDRMAYYIEDFGNTVSVSIPIALSESIKEGRIKKGSKVLVAGFGIGYSWSGTVLYY